ncbi:amino acid adenylation domain-containing protein [Streptomyces sp. NBC_01537]|uniref:non-ribosomal peptide synthetase n=1 Tax=Streptomyces sp. NBC_01537 TaxID=2903896 RepID=UPI00386F2EE1
MGAEAQADRDFWRGVLDAGGFTAIPRWTVDPVAGFGEHESAIPDDLMAALRGPAGDPAASLDSALLAAHAKVLSALSGERDVVTGYVAVPGGPPLPCRLTTGPESWRALLLEARRAGSELLAHRGFPVGDLQRELGLTGPRFETVLDPNGTDDDLPGDLPQDTVLWVGCPRRGSRRVLRLRYRTDVLDAGSAARIAGYHLTALALLAADPDARHSRQSLLSPEELRFQLEGLAGRHRELPDRPFHELFEERVKAHPDTVAAVHGDRQWTYRELNGRANRLARALVARGLGREGVVAVVMGRDLDWMASVLAVFKAGGVYLPIEPQFPADRISSTLSRAGCGLVLTEPGSTKSLPEEPGITTLLVDDAYEEDHADGDLDVVVTPDQLAYIYFTSGSTGEPKGAMCEHAGMLNHLYAKIDDLEITEGEVVAQTAPQCFDISLWQLVAALLAGGRTLLVEQEVILDVQRFVDTIVDGRVAVLQVVPSYLDVVLSSLERQPRALPDLRCVSVTGEALKKELAQRWFAAEPGIGLVNAYGLTETSDDTNHEVMDRPPDGERVPLGRPVSNVRLYVVDERLSPVPLGAPGAIVFSGVCVGRGYVNDPERSRQAFMPDPHHQGQRLYRGGDYGRWLPDGKLEFLGRRDTQVKIRGFRIEIGEIENRLARVPDVHDGAVVVAERAGGSPHLVAFYTARRPLDARVLRDRLGESLPEYMIPSAFHWRASLPLSANGKTDRKALTALAQEYDGSGGRGGSGGSGGSDVAEQDFQAPVTPTERRLAAAWAKVLGIAPDRIDRRDRFFDRGGTSLTAVRLAIGLDRAVSLKDVTRHPVLAELAGLLDGRSERGSGLLQPLSEQDGARTGALVCFPYAGGNAVNFQPLAQALRGSGLAVHAVELPGHDVAGEREPFASIAQVVDQVVAEISSLGLTGLLLWGHSSGSAFALETARKLRERGVEVQRVFVGAHLLGDADSRRAAIADLTARSDAEIAEELGADGGYTELGQLDARRAGQVAAAYRHDCVSAHRYFAGLLDAPPAVRPAVPVTVVVAADDPRTARYADLHQEWRLLADRVDLCELADGGHYFLRTRPAEAARAVLRTVAAPARA